ncbi:hypothetical protein H7X87_01275 [Acetobacteraceae bacterium]|nr:hypothetical protein [Candidatus Parcubacteria bacterium]
MRTSKLWENRSDEEQADILTAAAIAYTARSFAQERDQKPIDAAHDRGQAQVAWQDAFDLIYNKP